ncbi:tryptophan synthase subunit alpha [Kineococcus sp. SYSU DK018]|uniref:tryptophan synthase subunit alpha n=1 Tax=Kineococcus sp. SYSU DK018 TaxID=3383139 RepID=UPI003D7D2597
MLELRSPTGGPGLVLFCNAGDPPLELLPELLRTMDDAGVACVELAVPFPGSPTDGPVVRASAERALSRGAGLDAVLATLARVRPSLRRTRVVLLADWAHSVRGTALPEFSRRVRDAGADALLLHGLPPVLRGEHLDSAASTGLPVVTTCYHGTSPAATIRGAAEEATAYVYLVASWGRSGTPPRDGWNGIAGTVQELRSHAPVPVAVGFGVRTAADVATLASCGADAAVVGSACVAALDAGARRGAPVQALTDLLGDLAAPVAAPA